MKKKTQTMTILCNSLTKAPGSFCHLVLVGAVLIGHRSLARYFRQSIRLINDETTGASIQGNRGKLAAIHGKILSVTGGCRLIFNLHSFGIAVYCVIAIFVLICVIMNEIVIQIVVHVTRWCYYDSSFLNLPSFF